MSAAKRERLASTIMGLQQRWGTQVLVHAGNTPMRPSVIPTGFPALDNILGIGGVPHGRISEFIGRPTVGATTLALKTIAQAQAEDHHAAYIDLARAFDPDYAVQCGVNLKRLLIVQPQTGREALDFADALLEGMSMVVLDSTTDLIAAGLSLSAITSGLGRITQKIISTPCALVLLTLLEPADHTQALPPTSAGHRAALRLWVEREMWLTQFGHLTGYKARITVLANRFERTGQSVSIKLRFKG